MPAPHDLSFPSSRRRALGLAAAALLPGIGACATEAGVASAPVRMSIIDRDNDQVLPVIRHEGRTWIAGRPGSRYAVRLANQTGARVLVVLSVDGVNAISGETAAWGQTGYVLDPWRSYDIAGWRKSDTAVAGFEFAALRDSYAARTGRPGNVGVIGIAVFLEKPAPAVAAAPPRPAQASALASATPQAKAVRADSGAEGVDAADAPTAGPPRSLAQGLVAESRERLGTAHGAREWSVSTRTTFERLGPAPQAVVEIAYDSRANLVTAGILHGPAWPPRPRPFPGSDDSAGFVADPPPR